MPKIPTFQPEVLPTTKGPAGPTAVEQDIRGFGMENLAAAQTWGNLGQMGEKLSEVGVNLNRHLTAYQDMHDLDQAKNFVNQRLLEYSQTVKNNPNPDDWLPAFRESMGTTLEAAKEGMNQRVSLYLDHHLTSVMPSYERSLAAAGRQTKISSFKGNIPKSLDQAAQTVVNAPDEIVAANAEASFKALVDTAARSDAGGPAYLTPKEGEAWKAKFDLAVKTGKVDKAMMQDPAGTLAALREPGAFGLTDTDRRAMEPRVTAHLHRVQQDNVLEIQKLYEGGQLTREDLKARRDGQTINLGTWKFYDAALQNDALPYADEMNYDTWAKRHKAAMNGQANPDEIYNDLKAGQYGQGTAAKATADQLIRLNDARSRGATPKELDFVKDPYFRLAAKEIEARLKPLETMGSIKGMMRGAKEATPTHEAARLFLDACKQAKAKGELTGPWMWQKANEIIRPFEMMGARGLKPGAGEQAPPAAEPPADPRQRALEILRKRGRLPEGRAKGGPVEEDTPYMVGERGPEALVEEGGALQIVGKQGPEVIVPDQAGEILPNDMLKKILDEYPGLKKVHSPETTSVMFASPERIAATKKAYGKENIGALEYWSKEEPGMSGLPHPTGQKGIVLELYDEKLKRDHSEMHIAILGDLLHGMPKDKNWAAMRDEFAKNFSPAAKELIKKRNCPPEARNSMIDAFIRGGIMPYKGGNWKDKEPGLYSPKQIKLLEQMEQYIKEN